MSDTFVLDASALLCLLQDETGAEQVSEILARSVIGAVNAAEVYTKLREAGGSAADITRAIGALNLAVEPFDEEQAQLAGALRLPTRPLGLSLGDRACLALAIARRAVAVTTDQAWSRLPANLGPSIRIVR